MDQVTKWLPRIFGCHCQADRSFFYKGKQFPICARCTGEWVGILIGLVVYPFFSVSYLIYLMLLFPMIIEGSIQMFTTYRSNNFKRFITGLLFGYGFISLFILSIVFTFLLGYHFKF